MAGKKRVGIVLFQLGGPDSLEAVEPFLLNLFLDPDIIPLGPLGMLRKPIAKLISSRRSIPVAGKYAEIGRRSPIRLLTERQRVRLVAALTPYIEPTVVTAMRYWHPMGEEAATHGVANHLKRFWTPKMISEIIGYLDSGQAGLNPAAARAVVALKQEAEAEAEGGG